MKITHKIISIPPYISTSWDKVSSLHMVDENLIITLKDHTRIAIPQLSTPTIEEVYAAHALFLEEQESKPQEFANQHVASQQTAEQRDLLAAPFRLLFGTLESISQALQHNPNYSNLAPLPQEIVSKIEMLAKTLPPEELGNFLHPVNGCNCMYCQISRILKGEHSADVADIEEATNASQKNRLEPSEDDVPEEDLRFEQWTVETIGDKMYLVTNKLDPTEHYSVYLGDPIGCTCGKQNCEHIVAVLRH